MFFAYKKLLGRTETRTRDRMYCQTIRTVRYISRDDRARIATCTFANTNRFKENYSIDGFQVVESWVHRSSLRRLKCFSHDGLFMKNVTITVLSATV